MGLRSSIRRLQVEQGAGDEQARQALSEIAKIRSGQFHKNLVKKYGQVLVGKAYERAKEIYSPMQITKIVRDNPESMVVEYLTEVGSPSEMEKVGKMLHNPLDDDVDPERFVVKNDGQPVELPVKKQRPPAPKMPDSQKLKGMSSNEIEKLVDQAHAAGIGTAEE